MCQTVGVRYIPCTAKAEIELTFDNLLPLPGLVLVEANVYLPQHGQLACDNGLKNGDPHFVSLLFGADTVRYILSFPLAASKLPELPLHPIKGPYTALARHSYDLNKVYSYLYVLAS